jgi:hypothetical protein
MNRGLFTEAPGADHETGPTFDLLRSLGGWIPLSLSSAAVGIKEFCFMHTCQF